MDRRLSGDEALFSGSTQIPSKSSINMVVRLSRRREECEGLDPSRLYAAGN